MTQFLQLYGYLWEYLCRPCSVAKLCDDIRILQICFLYLVGIALVYVHNSLIVYYNI